MKKTIIILLVILSITNVKAYTYSQWSTEYPEGVENILIESEVRYKWYKESIQNVEYLPKEYFGDKLVDLNDSKYSNYSDNSLVMPEELSERKIIQFITDKKFTNNDVDHIILKDFIFYENVYFSEVYVIDKLTNKKINYVLEDEYNNLYHSDFINNGDLGDYNKINTPMIISLNLGKAYNVNNLLLKIYYKSYDETQNKVFSNIFAVSTNYEIFNKTISLKTCENGCILNLEHDNTYEDKTNVKVIYYAYRDKLYKTYTKEIIYLDNYSKYETEYIKLEGSEKTFYRYIMDDYVYMDDNGNIITDGNYCNKNFCYLVYINKKESSSISSTIKDNNIENPKTIDSLNYYIVIFSISLMGILLFIFVKKNINKCRVNKRSIFVKKPKKNI